MAHPPPEDFLRLEHFGALYYSRRAAEFTALTPPEAELLLDARWSSLPEAWARQSDGRLSEEKLLATAARWRELGLLDDDLRCRARLVPRRWNQPILTGPLTTHLQLTHACNLTCSHCYVEVTKRPPPGELSLAQLDGLFAELEALASPRVVLAGGEPLLRADVWEILEALRAHRLDGWLCTNATFLKPQDAARLAGAGLRGVQVSLDGPSAEVHDAVRGAGRFEQALRGLRALLDAGVPGVEVRVTVNALNAAHLEAFGALALELGLPKTTFKPFRLTGASSGQQRLVVELPAYRRAVERAIASWPEGAGAVAASDGLTTRTPKWMNVIPPFGCVGGTVTATVTAQGAVVGCGSVLTKDDWKLGAHSFAECWAGAPNLASWRTLEGNDACRACANFRTCGGGCRARAVAVGRSMNEPDPWSHCNHPPAEHQDDGPRACEAAL
ncbi:MAG: radical SAM protein [Myxococcota bacterium]